MDVTNLKIHGLYDAIERAKYPMQIGTPKRLCSDGYSNPDVTRAMKLATAPVGSGHPNWLIGVNVQFDLEYTQYWTKHLQRYHWFQYYSGQSLMHRITAVKDIKDHCNKYVLDETILRMNELIELYNNTKEYPVQYKTDLHIDGFSILSAQHLFHIIISNCPMGYKLWVPVTTNYLQLINMYHQRRTHKLEDWQQFCDFVETLPLMKDFLKIKK